MSPPPKSSIYKQDWKGAIYTSLRMYRLSSSEDSTRNGPSAGRRPVPHGKNSKCYQMLHRASDLGPTKQRTTYKRAEQSV
jgi:hypothetical protein